MWRLHRNYLLGSLAMVAIAISIVVVRQPLGLRGDLWNKYIVMLFGALPLVFLPIIAWFSRRMRRQFRAARGRLCIHCAYNIGATGDVGACPECGKPYDVIADEEVWKAIGFKMNE